MPDPSHLPSPTAASRRAVLRAAGLAALSGGGLGVLGACSPATGTTTPASSAPTSSAAASAASATSSPPRASAASATSSPPRASPTAGSTPRTPAAVPSGPSVAASKVPVGGGVILQDANYVITQPTAGKFKAFSKICTHQQCPVTSVEGGTINCLCHGSKFSIKDGSVRNPPAPSPLPEAKVTVAGGRVVVTE